MRAERAVLDTNILISASLTGRKPLQVLRHVLENGVLIFSEPTFGELFARLMKPKFDLYVSRERRAELLADLEAAAEWTMITGALHGCGDPDDDKFLETALAGEATCLVSGDRDLLVLDPFEGIRIVTPAAFLRLTTP